MTKRDEKKSNKNGKFEAEVSRTNLFLLWPDDVWVCGYDTDDGEEHVLYDERVEQEPDQEFVDSIKRVGVLDPILARRNGERIEVTAGRRRVLGCRMANREREAEGLLPYKIAVKLVRGTESDMMDFNIITNIYRKPMTTMQCARMASRYIGGLGRSIQDAADAFNVSRQAISGWMKLTELISGVHTMVDSGELSATAAVDMFYGKTEEQQATLLAKLTNKADKTVRKPTNGRPRGPSRPTVRKLVDEVSGLSDCGGVHEEFIKALRFVLGEVSAEEIGVDRFIAKRSKNKKVKVMGPSVEAVQ